jgi:glutamate---cysteine ligase / carboxylate-amine ligase
MQPSPSPTAAELRATFDAPGTLGVGLEEELFLLDAGTLDLLPRASEAIERLDGDPRFKLELPAAQLEIVTRPARGVPEAIAALAAARRDLAAAVAPAARLMGAGAHPFAAALGVLNPGPRYDLTAAEYGDFARRQLVCGLHLHVSLGGADRTLAVYNALRSHLAELAALAANAPFHGGRDTGLASVRPTIASLLPRQGVPPAMSSWDAYADALRWGAAAGPVTDPRRWWWELRPHPLHGTLELRVPDAQATVADVGAVAAYAHALIASLAERHDAGEALPVADAWRLEENRWAACRSGLDAVLADPVTGAGVAARDLLAEQIERLAPVAERLGCAAQLLRAGELARENGALRARAVAAEHGIHGVAAWLAGRFLAGVPEAVAPT